MFGIFGIFDGLNCFEHLLAFVSYGNLSGQLVSPLTSYFMQAMVDLSQYQCALVA